MWIFQCLFYYVCIVLVSLKNSRKCWLDVWYLWRNEFSGELHDELVWQQSFPSTQQISSSLLLFSPLVWRRLHRDDIMVYIYINSAFLSLGDTTVAVVEKLLPHSYNPRIHVLLTEGWTCAAWNNHMVMPISLSKEPQCWCMWFVIFPWEEFRLPSTSVLP